MNTFLIEAESIVNSRPLTMETINDHDSVPITPMMLLTTKNQVVLPPPGNFESESMYSKKQWKRVQHLANEFWLRWKKEYLQSLQSRQIWQRPQRNFRVNDVVLIKDYQTERNLWKLGFVKEVVPGQDGNVRSCIVKTKSSELHRPVTKLILLIETNE